MTYSLRSKAEGTVRLKPDAPPMKSCSKTGATEAAVFPILSKLTGTSRQPRSVWPSSLTMRSTSALHATLASGSCGRKTRPAPYEPAGGSSNGTAWRRKRSGIWIRMPAPSPVSGSEPQAPRCSRLMRRSRAERTIWCERAPLMLATKPTPHASCSSVGLYKPCGRWSPSTRSLEGLSSHNPSAIYLYKRYRKQMDDETLALMCPVPKTDGCLRRCAPVIDHDQRCRRRSIDGDRHQESLTVSRHDKRGARREAGRIDRR